VNATRRTRYLTFSEKAKVNGKKISLNGDQ
jgi:hypothetical protein